MSKTEENKKPELIFKIGMKAKATNKTPEMIYLTANNDLFLWNTVKNDIKELRCQYEELNDIILSENGFWASDKQLEIMVNKKMIKVEMMI
jgi:hypothetical protein